MKQEEKEFKLIICIENAIMANSKMRDNALMYIPAFFAGIDLLRDGTLSFSSGMLVLSIAFIIFSFFCTEQGLLLQRKSIEEGTDPKKRLDLYDFANSALNFMALFFFIFGMILMVLK